MLLMLPENDIIVCCAPDTEEEEEDLFYQQLYQTTEQVSKLDMLLLMNDLNAKIGSCNKNREIIMGVHGLRELNNIGESPADFCYENDLVK